MFMWELAQDFNGGSQELMDSMYVAHVNISMSMGTEQAASVAGEESPLDAY